MTLKKAIEILEIDINQSDYTECPDFRTALALSLEALKLIQRSRQPEAPIKLATLPGETKE